MAVTQGHGNPDWTRDETILALNLYLACEGRVPERTDPRVVELSATLRSLPIHPHESKRDSFRNPAGVGLKLMNLRHVATGRGMRGGSAMDRQVWQDFGHQPELVAALAAQIVAQTGPTPDVDSAQVDQVDPSEEFAEGRVLTAVHRMRERNQQLRGRLIGARRASNRLCCDACGDGPKLHGITIDDAGFEAHHILPLSQSGPRRTSLKDLALLCATCHRLLHRAIQLERRWVSVTELAARLHTLGQEAPPKA